jgi:hypothetical protein
MLTDQMRAATRTIHNDVFPKAFALLPSRWDVVEARAELLAIGLQESRFMFRTQIGGPAHGFWQNEKGGMVEGVLRNKQTQVVMASVLDSLGYNKDEQRTPYAVYERIITDDVLAACIARCGLRCSSKPLPKQGEYEKGWEAYIDAWRPGAPHRRTFDEFFDFAWIVATEQRSGTS